jgi:uncharacterized protein (DUF427 family)
MRPAFGRSENKVFGLRRWPASYARRNIQLEHYALAYARASAKIMKANWNGRTLAESDNTVVVEGNHYFPKDSINTEFLQPSATHTVCGWKGTASYYDVVVNGETNPDAAWYYPETKPEAKEVEGYVAFWKGVEVTE